MKYILKITLLSIILFLFKCKRNNCQQYEIIGKYYNNYEKNVDHYVELKIDSTFVHYYNDKKNNVRKNIGTWKLSSRKDRIEIIFNSWREYGYENNPKCDGCIFFVRLEDGKLIFDEDLDKELNFTNSLY